MAKLMKIIMEFDSEVLGMSPSDPEIHKNYIASKAPDAPSVEEEVAALGVEEVVKNGTTIFPRDTDGRPATFAYQWLGFIKEAASHLQKSDGSFCKTIKAYKKVINGQIAVGPRVIPYILENPDEPLGTKSRTLRASTPQGERISIATSEVVPSGSMQEVNFCIFNKDAEKILLECLDSGIVHGTGQWRNGGYGRFRYEILNEVEVEDNRDFISAILENDIPFPTTEAEAAKALKAFEKKKPSLADKFKQLKAIDLSSKK